jgi:hypothetical protein
MIRSLLLSIFALPCASRELYLFRVPKFPRDLLTNPPVNLFQEVVLTYGIFLFLPGFWTYGHIKEASRLSLLLI